ncbi:MAG: Hook-filament junction protein [Candidatus Accumulibacter appositus]|uniref:Hook-filament junction protein n=1 Tax=Candidatus Accumulibacter appositus TaxID=1454003 RepID=A0A011PWR6_9PROT|nr:flagellar hook-associated protein FlgL [Accumulibacter sp.]EXI81442.1 MAG: Hook-filament junction protein [Candidatus Accumulibacter appositus]HRF03294.1 flagellar hook-associated protein FlgL [Accumulibacter sp.]
MRISSNQLYDAGVRGMERNQSQLLKLQEQISSGRRILTPADDPVGAARALTVTQTREVAAQYARNQGAAVDRLGLVDSQLGAVTDLLQSVRGRVIQAGNTILSDSDRQAVASELEARFSELLGIANSQSAEGDYLFAGHQGATTPFVLSAATSSAAPTAVRYFGDDGERLLQVGLAQLMPTSIAGSDLFMNIRQGNGSFLAAAGGANASSVNQGSGVIDSGSVLDPQKWQRALNSDFWQGSSNQALEIRFSSVAGDSHYQLFDVSTPAPPAAPMPARPVSELLPFTAGQAIPLLSNAPAADFGAQVVINGRPADGDSFSITPSGNKSVFQTMQELIGLLKSPLGSSQARSEFTGQLAGHLNHLDQAQAKVSSVQASVGSRLQALDGLSNSSAAVDILHQQSLSALQDLDYAQALSDFTRQQLSLEAAQKSFVTISGLSLFSYL